MADSNGTAQLNLADGSVVQGKFGVGDGYGGITSLHEVISSALLIEDRGFKFLVPAHVTVCGLGNGGSSQSDESPLGGYFTVPSGTKPASLSIPSGPTLDLNGSPAQCSEPSPVPGGMTLPAKVTMPGTGASGQIVAQVEMAPYDGMDTSQEPKLTVVNMSAKTVGFNAIYLLTLFQDGMLAMQRPQDCADTVSSGASASCQYLYTHLVPGSHLILEAPDYGVAAIIG